MSCERGLSGLLGRNGRTWAAATDGAIVLKTRRSSPGNR